MVNPDKYIRKEIYDLINNMEVGGHTINCYDSRIVGPDEPMHYVLLSSQTKQPTAESKCGFQWDCTILLDVITRFTDAASRVLANDIEEEIITLMLDFALPDTFLIKLEDSNSMDVVTQTETMFRQLMRYRIIINN